MELLGQAKVPTESAKEGKGTYLEGKSTRVRLIPGNEYPIDQLVVGRFPFQPFVEAISDELLVPRPRRNLAQEFSERGSMNPRFGFILFSRTRGRRGNGFRRDGRISRSTRRIGRGGITAFQDGKLEVVIDETELVLVEPASHFEGSKGRPFRKSFDGNDHFSPESFSLPCYRFIRDVDKFAERHNH